MIFVCVIFGLFIGFIINWYLNEKTSEEELEAVLIKKGLLILI